MCPNCGEDLKIISVDFEGYDEYGCGDCEWKEEDKNMDEEMSFYF